METHRIKVKLGDAEFDAEGSAEAVQAQYDAFLKLVEAARTKPTTSVAIVPQTPTPFTPETPIPPAGGAVRPATLDRVFRKDDNLSLVALPSGDAREEDAMLALLYGYRVLLGVQHVTGTLLKKSALLSGVTVDRADRIMNGLIPNFVLAGGVKKAKRYQLNNRGTARAEAIINSLQ